MSKRNQPNVASLLFVCFICFLFVGWFFVCLFVWGCVLSFFLSQEEQVLKRSIFARLTDFFEVISLT